MLPKDPCFQLAYTTIKLLKSAGVLGHVLGNCNLKVRMYENDEGLFLEFHRRSGDAMVFSGVFRRAVAFIKHKDRCPGITAPANFMPSEIDSASAAKDVDK